MKPARNRRSRTAGTASPTRPERTSSSLHTSPALASSDSVIDTEPGGPIQDGPALRARAMRRATSLGAWRSDGAARWVFIWPTVLVILFLSIFPLIASVALSVSKLAFHKGGVDLDVHRLHQLPAAPVRHRAEPFPGSVQDSEPHRVGRSSPQVWQARSGSSPGPSARGQLGPFGLALRLMAGIAFVGFLWLLVGALASPGGRPGALFVTLIFVFGGISLQVLLGLGLAMLCTQAVPWRRFFRVAFLIPLTITPVGVGYMFLMMTDTSKGPLEPIWVGLGLRGVLVGERPLGRPRGGDHRRHVAVDPVRVHRPAGGPREPRPGGPRGGSRRWRQPLAEFPQHHLAGHPAGASRRSSSSGSSRASRSSTCPTSCSVADRARRPRSLSLQAYIDWNTLNLGRSAAVAYLLLIVVTLVATVVREPRSRHGHGSRVSGVVAPGSRQPSRRRMLPQSVPSAIAST